MKSLYEILGVDSSSGKDEIKKRYRELAKKYHPDRMVNAGEKEKAEAEKRFREINDAYTILSDDEKRLVMMKKEMNMTKWQSQKMGMEKIKKINQEQNRKDMEISMKNLPRRA